MLILGIVLVVIGLLVFMGGGALTNNAPGVEKGHLAMMAIGGFVLLAGIIITIATVVQM